jgi:hypothetical protein
MDNANIEKIKSALEGAVAETAELFHQLILQRDAKTKVFIDDLVQLVVRQDNRELSDLIGKYLKSLTS